MLVVSCATIEPSKPSIERYWPVPPDPPRIAYVRSFSHPKDMGKKRSWFSFAFRVLFGERQAPHMLRPFSVTVDRKGLVYVADTGLQAVHIYDFSRKKYRQIFWIEMNRSRFLSPAGVAVDAAGNVYVSDSQLNRIFVYDRKRYELIKNHWKDRGI